MLIVRPAASATPSGTAPLNLQWVHSTDGQTVSDHGLHAPALLPADAEVVLVVPAALVSWHQVALPRIAAARLRQALEGLLEDRLLSDPASLHLAVAPGAQPGQSAWVAACQKATLKTWLDALQTAGRPATRIVPEAPPCDPPQLQALMDGDEAWLLACGPAGVLRLPLPQATDTTAHAAALHASAWARQVSAVTPGSAPTSDGLQALTRRTEPACATQAESQLGLPFDIEPMAQRLLRASQTPWNLAQFDLKLSAGARRNQQLLQGARALWHAPAWAPTRWGLAALLASLVLGLNLVAWQEQSELQAKREATRRVLTDTFAHVTLVIDAPLQMQREVAALQRASGGVGRHDLEPLLQDVAAAAPPTLKPTALELTPTERRLSYPGASTEAMAQLQAGLSQRGWRSQFTAPTLVVTPASPAKGTP